MHRFSAEVSSRHRYSGLRCPLTQAKKKNAPMELTGLSVFIKNPTVTV